jgi:FKBP-type peptidyl-prolyl cis-trans isomerase FkpA
MKQLMLILCFVMALASCKKKEEPCTLTAGNTVAPASERTQVTSYLGTNGINATELDNSGLFYLITAPGSSERATQCAALRVKYKGQRADGVIFDQTVGENVATFVLGNLIEGWKRALPLIGEGGKMRLFIPPSMGYGSAGLVNNGVVLIPPNSMLIFDIELLSITN